MNSILRRLHRSGERLVSAPRRVALAALGALACIPILACGPFFPNSLLDSGDASVLRAPTAAFGSELERLRLEPPPRLTHLDTRASDADATLEAEIADLRRALAARGLDAEDTARVVLAFSGRRADLTEYRRAMDSRPARESGDGREAGDPAAAEDSAAPFEVGQVPAEIPREFVLYFEGAAAWHSEQTEKARAAWTALLELPVSQRPFKTTWASYMLARSWHEEDPAAATKGYQRTRAFARDGFADSASLAVASLGWEAQLRLRAGDLAGAMNLYLDQYAAGSTHSSLLSLAVCAERVSQADPEQRLSLARNRTLRRVITAWHVSQSRWSYAWESGDAPTAADPALPWLEALEEVRAGDVELAEQLALLAYQAGQWDAARRWVDLSGESVVARWVGAKLALRAGNLDTATSELAEIVRQLPLDPEPPARGTPAPFASSLTAAPDDVEARFQVRGELGMLKLARGDFRQALDLFLRAGFWRDAAYVAERVLTTDELKSYVDRNWPEQPQIVPDREGTAVGQSDSERITDEMAAARRAMELRYLLARRLARDQRGSEAGPYYPEPLRADHQRLAESLEAFRNPAGSPAERAAAGAAAAWMTRTNGIELLGTELAPDFAIWGGAYDSREMQEERQSTNAPLTRGTSDELARAEAHHPEPDTRFHYRYQAAQLAWDASKLMPNNDPATAQLLYDAGSWLKAQDPKTADLFYKALVNRCRKTELGDAADRQRWFPPLDATGRPYVTRKPKVSQPVEPPAPSQEPPGQPAEIMIGLGLPAEDDNEPLPVPKPPSQGQPLESVEPGGTEPERRDEDESEEETDTEPSLDETAATAEAELDGDGAATPE